MVRIKLVGCNFHKASKKTVENEVVRLVREPDNEFDRNAIAVLNGLGEKIGYVGTKKTVSDGNRKNGCIDNEELGEIMASEGHGVITKFRDYFGFIEVTF